MRILHYKSVNIVQAYIYYTNDSKMLRHVRRSILTDTPLRMQHERHARPWRECPPRFAVPATVGVPVHVSGVDAAIGVDALHDGDVAVVACALRVGLQYNYGGHMWRARHDPPGGPCAVGPLIGIANPVHPVT